MAKVAEVIVIGGGVVGCSVAYHLARANVKGILVVEKGRIGGEASWAAAGMLAPQCEAPGPGPFLDLCLVGRAFYESFALELRDLTGIDIEYLPWGILSIIEKEGEEEAEAREMWQKKMGLRVEKLKPEEVAKLEPGLKREIAGALFFPDDHHVNNREMMRALAQASRSLGVEFCEESPVQGFVFDEDRVRGVKTPQGVLLGEKIVIAAGCWSGELYAFLERRLPVKPARGQIVYTELQELPLRHVVWGREGYLVPRLNGGLLIGSTVEFVGFDKQVTLEGVRRLTAMALDLLPGLAEKPLVSVWAGLRPHSQDGLPFIGPVPDLDGVFVATGHFRNGILLGPITGKLVAELLLQKAPSFPLEAFSPARFGSL